MKLVSAFACVAMSAAVAPPRIELNLAEMGDAVQASTSLDTDWTERCPASASTTEANCPFPTATAFDHNNNAITVHQTVERVTGASDTATAVTKVNGAFPITWDEPAIYLFKYFATDSVGNDAEHIVFELVLDDLVPPVVNCGAQSEYTLQVDDAGMTLPQCTVTDAISTTTTSTYTIYSQSVSGSDTAAAKTLVKDKVQYAEANSFFTSKFDTLMDYTVVVEGFDSAGMFGAHGENNKAVKEISVKVVDTTEPTLVVVGSTNMEMECGTSFLKDSSGNFVDMDGNAVTAGNEVRLFTKVVGGQDIWQDPGVTVSDNYDTMDSSYARADPCGSPAANNVQCLDPWKAGNYIIEYTAADSSGNIGQASRSVKVVDTVAPLLRLNGPGDLQYHQKTGAEYDDPGIEVEDNCDGNLIGTDQVSKFVVNGTHFDLAPADNVITTVNTGGHKSTLYSYTGHAERSVRTWYTMGHGGAGAIVGDWSDLQVGMYTKHYEVKDRAGNAGDITRDVTIVDNEKPILQIVCHNDETSCSTHEIVDADKNLEYNDEGATCQDYVHGNLNRAVRSTGDIVKRDTPGDYYVTYTCKDPSGNHAVPITKTITVQDITCPTATLQGDATVSIEAGFPFSDQGVTCSDTFSSCSTATVGNTVNYADAFKTSENCRDVKARYNGAASGTYMLMANDGTSSVAVPAYCDMEYVRTYFWSDSFSGCSGDLMDCSTGTACWSGVPAGRAAAQMHPALYNNLLDSPSVGLCTYTAEAALTEVPKTAVAASTVDNMANIYPKAQGAYVIQYTVTDEAGNKLEDSESHLCDAVLKRTVHVSDTLPPVITLRVKNKLVAMSHNDGDTGDHGQTNTAYLENTATQTGNPFLSLMAESTTQVNGWAVAAIASFVAGVALLSYTSKSSTQIPV